MSDSFHLLSALSHLLSIPVFTKSGRAQALNVAVQNMDNKVSF